MYRKIVPFSPIRGRGKWPAVAGIEGMTEVGWKRLSSLPFFSFRFDERKNPEKKEELSRGGSPFQATAMPEGPGAYQAHAGATAGEGDENACEEERAIGAEGGAEVAGL